MHTFCEEVDALADFLGGLPSVSGANKLDAKRTPVESATPTTITDQHSSTPFGSPALSHQTPQGFTITAKHATSSRFAELIQNPDFAQPTLGQGSFDSAFLQTENEQTSNYKPQHLSNHDTEDNHKVVGEDFGGSIADQSIGGFVHNDIPKSRGNHKSPMRSNNNGKREYQMHAGRDHSEEHGMTQPNHSPSEPPPPIQSPPFRFSSTTARSNGRIVGDSNAMTTESLSSNTGDLSWQQVFDSVKDLLEAQDCRIRQLERENKHLRARLKQKAPTTSPTKQSSHSRQPTERAYQTPRESLAFSPGTHVVAELAKKVGLAELSLLIDECWEKLPDRNEPRWDSRGRRTDI